MIFGNVFKNSLILNFNLIVLVNYIRYRRISLLEYREIFLNLERIVEGKLRKLKFNISNFFHNFFVVREKKKRLFVGNVALSLKGQWLRTTAIEMAESSRRYTLGAVLGKAYSLTRIK